MKSNKRVAMGNFGGPNSAKTAQEIWEAVAIELNATGGAKKSAEQWKKSWADWKCAVKKQQSKIKRFQNRTGNLPQSDGPASLDDIDVEVLEFVPSAAVEGDGGTKESGFTQFETITAKEEVLDMSVESIRSTPSPKASTSRSQFKMLDTPKATPIPKSSTSQSQGKTFASSFEEIKKYMKEQDERRMKEMEAQTELLKGIFNTLKSIDSSLKPCQLKDDE